MFNLKYDSRYAVNIIYFCSHCISWRRLGLITTCCMNRPYNHSSAKIRAAIKLVKFIIIVVVCQVYFYFKSISIGLYVDLRVAAVQQCDPT